MPLPVAVTDDIAAQRWKDLWEPSGTIRLLNHGSFGRPFRIVRELQNRLEIEIDADPAEHFRETHEQVIRSAADEVARSLGVSNDKTVAFRHNVSTAIIDVVGSLAGSSDVVLTTNLGYGGIEIGSRHLGDKVGFRLVTLGFEKLDDVTLFGERVLESVREHLPAVVVLDEITSDTALLLPVNEMAGAIREISPMTKVIVDGAHSGMLSNPCIDTADVWVTNLHKWPCAARGAGVIVAGAGAEIRPLQGSWTGDETFPGSFTWTGTDDRTAFLTAPLALRVLDSMRTHGLDTHINEVLDKTCTTLSAEWDVAPDARPETMRAPWMRLVRLPVPGPRTYDWAASVMTAARRSLDLDVAVTFFGEDAYVRLSAHGYNELADYERVAGLPALLTRD